MDCLFVREHLFSYREKQLSEKENKAFEDHLHSCGECYGIVAGFQAVAAVIDQKKADEPNPFIRTRTIQRIESALEQSKETVNPLFRRSLQPVIVSLFLLISVAIGFSIGKQINSNFTRNNEHNIEIEDMKSGLSIADFIDEDYMLFTNN
ncbi:MAG: zf-HC2 domain-containing protein [Bacteroidota bacterium]